MLDRLKNLFKGNLQITIETYGKLPFYKDYISIVVSRTAKQWKLFMLDFFSREGIEIPPGNWPFIYHESPKSDFIVGLIENSSDGIRKFPFSLFTTCKPRKGDSPYCLHTTSAIWKELLNIREKMENIYDIDTWYDLIRDQRPRVTIDRKAETDRFISNLDVKWPRLYTTTFDDPNKLFPLLDESRSPHECTTNWKRVAEFKEKVEDKSVNPELSST